MRNGFKVIDADAHMQDELANWLDFVEPAYQSRKPRVQIVEDAFGGLGGKRQVEVLPCELFPQGQARKASLQGSGPSSREGRIDLSEYMPKSMMKPFMRSGAPRAASRTWTDSVGTSR